MNKSRLSKDYSISISRRPSSFYSFLLSEITTAWDTARKASWTPSDALRIYSYLSWLYALESIFYFAKLDYYESYYYFFSSSLRLFVFSGSIDIRERLDLEFYKYESFSGFSHTGSVDFYFRSRDFSLAFGFWES